MNFDGLCVPALQGLRAYDPGHDLVAWRRRVGPSLVELGSNENPWGPSPAARAAVLDQLHAMHRYPDPLGGDLKRALAAKHGVGLEQLILGNGSHELLMQLAQVFAGAGDEVVASQFGFAVYAIATQAAGAALRVAPALPRDHATMPRGHDLDAIADAVGPRTKLVFLANPNNPTGTHLGIAALSRFLERIPPNVLVVVDEAYAEFVESGESALSLLASHPGLIVTRTFSKAYALAGLRIGFAVAHPALIAVMERVRESFNVNHMGLAAAEAALGDGEHLQWGLARNAEERTRLADALATRGWFVHPSQTNFLLVEFGARAGAIEAGLLERGVIPRPMGGYGLPECLRITIGDRDENRRFLDALDHLA
ncbi:Histidinol-phosphate aminotransferase [Lysobacter dokdonensis DS-58]|uniref:Histidinol-phosphate aminotransferase n=1 Tax=Lysobacter dokdonensis DS-58 TaxID=1300345 RepID=A0A0A2WHW9_9GAMM|nr:histidinol-phosphate transaminase [Lysobacter dokdonensis]KGQ19408.1 Histidinol-phosphate aminotransferase [Lysobacter dokdonensis DS-58]